MLNGILVYLKNKTEEKDFLTKFVIGLSYLFLGFRFFYFIYKFTPKLLFWDEWDTVQIFLNSSPLQLLFSQHNEHRHGVGFVITQLLVNLSHWNLKYETLFTGLVIFLASIFALLIKKRISKKLEIYDIFIPLLFLNLYQWENLTWGFQIAYTLPLLFLLINVYLFTFKDFLLRNLGITIFSLLSVYSAFQGLFVAFLSALFFLIKLFQYKDSKNRFRLGVFFVIVILGVASYFINYQRSPYLGESNFNLIYTFFYILLVINNIVGLAPHAFYSNLLKLAVAGFGLLVLPLTTLATFLFLTKKIIKDKDLTKYYPLFSLFLFSFIFIASVTYGRSGLGFGSAVSPRYNTFLIPLFFGVYLVFTKFEYSFKKIILPLFLIFFIFATLMTDHLNYERAGKINNNLESWRVCYLKIEDISKCNLETKFLTLQADRVTLLQQELFLLKTKKLNLYSK